MLEVAIVGSGTGVPSLKRASPAILVKTDGLNVLLDSGPGTLRQLLKLGINYAQLDLILYTHFHPDHIADLIHFLFAAKYEPCFKRETPTIIAGPPGFLNWYEALKGVFQEWVTPSSDKVRLIEMVPQRPWTYKDVSILAFKTCHTEESQGYCLQTQGKKVVYTGDTAYSQDLVPFIKDADLLICEASFPDEVKGHLTPFLAGKLATEARAKRMVLVHLYPECDKTDILAQCRKVYAGELIVGSDLLWLKV